MVQFDMSDRARRPALSSTSSFKDVPSCLANRIQGEFILQTIYRQTSNATSRKSAIVFASIVSCRKQDLYRGAATRRMSKGGQVGR